MRDSKTYTSIKEYEQQNPDDILVAMTVSKTPNDAVDGVYLRGDKLVLLAEMNDNNFLIYKEGLDDISDYLRNIERWVDLRFIL